MVMARLDPKQSAFLNNGRSGPSARAVVLGHDHKTVFPLGDKKANSRLQTHQCGWTRWVEMQAAEPKRCMISASTTTNNITQNGQTQRKIPTKRDRGAMLRSLVRRSVWCHRNVGEWSRT